MLELSFHGARWRDRRETVEQALQRRARALMLLLGIETATRRVGVVLASEDGMLGRVELGGHADAGPPRHAEQLAPAIEYCCEQIGDVARSRVGDRGRHRARACSPGCGSA